MNIKFNEQNAYYITSNLEDIIINDEYYINIKKIKDDYEKNSKNILSCIYWQLLIEFVYRTIRNFLLR